MSDKEEVPQFAERLMRFVRDPAIEASDQLTRGEMRGPRGDRWRSYAANEDVRRALEALIPDVVDKVLFELLDAIDNDNLPLGWRRSDGSFADLQEIGHGEMAGWLARGGGGWLDLSTQRYFDYLADLKPINGLTDESGNS